MYEAFYGFREKPFSILPDPDFLYLSPKHSMALALLEYGLMNQAGFNVITGEIGTGKTTLIRHLLGQLRSDVTVGLISNTHRSFGELLQWILYAFNLEGGRGMGKVEMFQRFVEFLVAQYSENRRTVLIIDEAQNMAPDTLEELRMLSNVNADKDQVLQVILVGQAELRDTLRRPDMRQFAQRIAVDYHLEALNRDESRTYIRHRIHVAGGTDKLLFDDGACDAVFDHSQGVPRLINLLCDTALVYAFADQQRRVDAQLVRDVARDKQQGGLFPSPEKKTLLNESEPHEEQLYPALLVEDPPLNGGERHATRTAIPIADADAVHDGPAPAQTNDVAALDLVILDYLKSRHAELYFKLKTVVDGLLKRRDERIP